MRRKAKLLSEPANDDRYFVAAPPDLSALGALVRKADPDRFEAALLAPPATRERLFTLYAFNLEVARAPWRSQEPHIALMRLQWWRDTIQEAADGASARAHEVAEPLHHLIAGGAVDVDDLEAIIDARETEIEPSADVDEAALATYLEQSSGALMRAAARLCVDRALSAEEGAHVAAFGAATGLARLLEATPLLAARGRVILPLAQEDRAALLGGETTQPARDLCASLARDAISRMAAARRARRSAPRAAAPALLAAWRADRVLRIAQSAAFDIFADLAPESPFRRRASLLFRAATGRW